MSEKKGLERFIKDVAFTLASEIKEDRFAGKVSEYNIKTDRHGRKILLLFIETPKYGRVVVAYSPMFAKMLYERLKQLGIEDVSEFFGQCFEFERVKAEKVREDYTDPYPRYLPIKKISCDYIE